MIKPRFLTAWVTLWGYLRRDSPFFVLRPVREVWKARGLVTGLRRYRTVRAAVPAELPRDTPTVGSNRFALGKPFRVETQLSQFFKWVSDKLLERGNAASDLALYDADT